MNSRTLRIGAIALTLASITACSGKANETNDDKSPTGDVSTDIGVSDSEIVLGVQTDLSGPFKALGLGVTNGNQLWAKDVNDDGGICGREIVLDIQDTGYKPENAVVQYEQQKGTVVGMLQLIGSPMLAALKQKLVSDKMLTIPISWASSNLDAPEILMIGQTFDLETINGLAYAQEQGMIADGDKVGHVYIDSEFGQNAMTGASYYAKEHDLQMVNTAISAQDTDMTATITKMKQEGVTAIFMSTSPAATGSAALQNVAQDLNVPIIGNSSTYAPTMLADDQLVSALEHYYHVDSLVPFGTDNELGDAIEENYRSEYTDPPSLQVYMGYVTGLAFQAVLEEACDAGDLTRAGLVEARQKVSGVDTHGLMGELSFSKAGAPTTREATILKVDSAAADDGGLVLVEELFEAPEASEYKAPHEK